MTDPGLHTVEIKLWEFDCSTKVGGVEAGSSRPGCNIPPGRGRKGGVVTAWRKNMRVGRIRGRSVYFVAIS